MKAKNAFFGLVILIIVPFTVLNSVDSLLSFLTDVSAKTTLHEMDESGAMDSNTKHPPKTGLNQLQPRIPLCSRSEGDIEWSRTYGGLKDDYFASVIETNDGSFIITGTTYSDVTGSDFWLIKTDSNGYLQWNRTYGGPSNEQAKVVIPMQDGGFLLAGMIGLFQVWLVKTDPFGEPQWNRTYGSIRSSEDTVLTTGIPTTDGGFALAWNTGEHGFTVPWVYKFDSQGVLQWREVYNSSKSHYVQVLIEIPTEGFVLAGNDGFNHDMTGGNSNFWLLKTDKLGIPQWNRTYDYAESENLLSAVQTEDGGYLLAGQTETELGGEDAWLIKTDSTGRHVWNQTYHIAGNEEIPSIIQMSDGNIVFSMEVRDYQFGDVITKQLLLKIRPNCKLLWNQTYGCSRNSDVSALIQARNGGLVFVGYKTSDDVASSDAWILKTVPFDNWRPVISELDDFRYLMGMGKPIPILNWSVEDHCPETYMIYVNSEQVDSGSWENGTISWSLRGIAGFNIGIYNITIVIQDMNGNRASDTVIVEVWDVIMTKSEFFEFRWTILLVFVSLILFYMRVNRGRVQ